MGTLVDSTRQTCETDMLFLMDTMASSMFTVQVFLYHSPMYASVFLPSDYPSSVRNILEPDASTMLAKQAKVHPENFEYLRQNPDAILDLHEHAFSCDDIGPFVLRAKQLVLPALLPSNAGWKKNLVSLVQSSHISGVIRLITLIPILGSQR